MNLNSELNSFIASSSTNYEQSMNDLEKQINQEIVNFEQTGFKGKFLKFTYEHISEMKPTSVDDALDSIIVIKNYYKNLEIYKKKI